jgi:ribonuclease T1
MQVRAIAIVLSVVIGIGAILATGHAVSRESTTKAVKASDFATIKAGDMPKQGQETLALIRRGGPFPYSKDGSTFGNRERILPKEARGFYKEYTVKTPGSRDRGARRIVCGGDVRSAANSTCYYTADHYASFKRIVE